MKKKDDLQPIIDMFRIESHELLETLADRMLSIENDTAPDRIQAAKQEAFRCAHNIKGAAATLQFTAVERFIHVIEDILDAFRSNTAQPEPEVIDAIIRSLDAIDDLISSAEPGEETLSEEAEGMIAQLRSFGIGQPAPAAKQQQTETLIVASEHAQSLLEKTSHESLIRISQTKLDALLNYLGELVEMKIRMEQMLGSVRRIEEELSSINLDVVKSPQRTVQTLSVHLVQDIQYLGKLLRSIQDELKEARMSHVNTLFPLLRRTVRDVARKQNVLVDFHVEGGEIELDRKILEEIKNPLIHTIRNAVYHGLETASERLAQGKGERGQLIVKVSQAGNHVSIQISDDGRGIDFARILEKARENGFYSNHQEPTEAELTSLLFVPGTTTAREVDEIAGRGVGLDVVRKAIEELRGTISVTTSRGAGTIFNIVLPQLLASNVGIVIQTRSNRFIIPRQSVERAIFFKDSDISSTNNHHYLWYENRNIPIAVLGSSLELMEFKASEAEDYTAIVVHSADSTAALVVNRVEGEVEIMVRDLGSFIRHVPKISGVTISSSGEMLFVLEPGELISEIFKRTGTLTERTNTSVAPSGPATSTTPTQQLRTILVVDDSVTSRNLTRNMLNVSGFEVVIAADGLQALERLASSNCHLVLSDIQMPNMDGYELTRRIKASPLLKQIPVVLLSSLSSDNNKAQGLEAGADAYLVKSELTHSLLISTLERLL